MSELIDREALKDAVKRYAGEPIKKKDRKCQAICLDMLGTIDAQPTASPWHRVEDELPEPIHPTDPRYKAYLICDALSYMHVADYTYSKHFPTCYSFHVNGEEETDVKYWMPIEPPKEDA